METILSILLVEDDRLDADYIREILSFPGEELYRIEVSSRLEDALIHGSENPFDIILTDLNLPDSEGLGTFHRLNTRFPRLPIVVLTGLNDSETGKMAVQQGAQDFLVKNEITGETLKRALTYAVERKKNKDKLEETHALKELLLDVITHDLKNNAGSIHGLSDLLYQKDPGNNLLECLKEGSERILKVIENTSTLARISSGEEIERTEMDICQVIHEVIEEFDGHLDASQMKIVFLPECQELVRANPIIYEVFKNYIANAIRYAPEGKKIIIDLVSETDAVQVKVSDLGIPIPEEKREMIFRRKVQLNGKGRKGSGLGLAIVKGIAEMHNGRAWVEPYLDRGNSFCITINRD